MAEKKKSNVENEIINLKNLFMSGMSVEDESRLYLYLPVKDKTKCLKMNIYKFDENKFSVLYGKQAEDRCVGNKLVSRFDAMANSIVREGAKLDDFLCEGTSFSYESVDKLKEANKCMTEAFANVEKMEGYDLMSNNEVMTNVIKNLGIVYSKELTLEFNRGFALKDNHNNYLVYQQTQDLSSGVPLRKSLENCLFANEKINIDKEFHIVGKDKVKQVLDVLSSCQTNEDVAQHGSIMRRLYLNGKKTTLDNLVKDIEKIEERKLNEKKKEISRTRLRPVPTNSKNKVLELTSDIHL